MVESLSQIFGTTLAFGGVLTLIVLGLLAAWGIYDKTLRDRRKEAVAGADDVIRLLKEQVDALSNRVQDLEDEQEIHIRQITELKATNETLTKILQGRDEATLAFQREVLAAVKLGGETNEITRRVEGQIGTMSAALLRLAEAIEKDRANVLMKK